MSTDEPETETVIDNTVPRTWRDDAAAVLRSMADELEAGRGVAVLAVTVVAAGENTQVLHYHGCMNALSGAFAVFWTMQVLDVMRQRIQEQQQSFDQKLATLLQRVQSKVDRADERADAARGGSHG